MIITIIKTNKPDATGCHHDAMTSSVTLVILPGRRPDVLCITRAGRHGRRPGESHTVGTRTTLCLSSSVFSASETETAAECKTRTIMRVALVFPLSAALFVYILRRWSQSPRIYLFFSNSALCQNNNKNKSNPMKLQGHSIFTVSYSNIKVTLFSCTTALQLRMQTKPAANSSFSSCGRQNVTSLNNKPTHPVGCLHPQNAHPSINQVHP